jgi:adapter protein MecA 1/2
MKIERIDENKIKVTLSLDDLHERNIDLSALSYNSPQAQQLFMDMMNIAESEYGFLIGDSQIFIEAVPTPPEGFEIIVTKVEDDKEFESIHKYIKNRLKKSDLSSKKRNKKVSTNIFVCCFTGFEDLCQAVNHIAPMYIGCSSLYKYKDNYYLVIYKNYKDGLSFKPVESTLNEFGTAVAGNIFLEGLLDEHGEKLIEDNAVDVISSYFHK